MFNLVKKLFLIKTLCVSDILLSMTLNLWGNSGRVPNRLTEKALDLQSFQDLGSVIY